MTIYRCAVKRCIAVRCVSRPGLPARRLLAPLLWARALLARLLPARVTLARNALAPYTLAGVSRAGITLASVMLISMPAALAEWDGDIEGGTVLRDGNSASRLRLSLNNDARPFTQSIQADWIRYRNGNGYRLGYLPRFWIDERLYLFGSAEYRVEQPLGIDRSYLASAGAGYRLFDTKTRQLGLEAGAGIRGTRFEGGTGGSDAEDTEPFVQTRAYLVQTLLEQLRADADLSLIAGETIGEQQIDVGIAYRVGGGAVRLGYRLRRLTRDDAPSIDDDSTSVSFVYGF